MNIHLHQHPFSAEPPQVFEADSLALWLLDHYGETPKVTVQVFRGEPSAETDITGDVRAILEGDAPVYVVLESPGDPISILINIAIAVVLQAVSTLLFGGKDKPIDKANRTQESPNNQLSDRENRVRVMERVEDIYGTVRSIPSLLMPTYAKYINHQKVEYGYYCIGRGYYDVEDLRDGDSLLSEVTGASAEVYAPFTSPNSGTPQLQIGDAIIDGILSVRRSGSVDGVTLLAANQIELQPGAQFYFYAGDGPGVPGVIPAHPQDIIYQGEGQRRPNFASIAEAGQTLTITMSNVYRELLADGGIVITVDAATKTYTASGPGSGGFFNAVVDGVSMLIVTAGNPANGGTFTVVSHTGTTLTVAEAVVNEGPIAGFAFQAQLNYSGTRTIAGVESGFVRLVGAQWNPQVYPLASTFDAEVPPVAHDTGLVATITIDNGLSHWSDWYTLPETDRTEVWANTVARAGIYKDDGSKQSATVDYEIQIEQLDGSLNPLGVVETVTGSLSGAESKERAETLEQITGWVGPARVRARRTTLFDYDFEGNVIDEIQLVDLYSVSPVTKAHFGNKTTIHTITKANADATTLRRRELNCLVSRKLPIYDGAAFSGAFDADGLHVSGTIAATSKIVDIIAAVSVDPKIGNRVLADDVDMAQIWATQQALDAWHPEVGQFNHTFDSDEISFEETVNAIANAAFCVAYRQNGKIRLALDRPQSTSVALFTHRNKKPNAETITRKFASESEYDGVELVYNDPDTEDQETIRLPLDGSYTKLKKVEITGIRSYEQAWFRANREYNRLLSQRVTIETETTTDARSLLPNSRVDIVDNTRFKSWDGEVIAQSGLTLTLSRDVEFLPGEPHSIVLMKRDGSLQSIACTAGAEPNQVVLAGAPAEAIVTNPTPDDGVRTIFSFAADVARPAQAWLVQEIGTSDGQYVRIRAVNYSDDYYAADDEAVPAKASVIND
ncbi:MAG: hypothetical protein K0S48_5 [Ramlibacter sp.]|jgi:hypothetical protein|nr:hypothetical protein [Ramlibacter sp.]